MHSMLKTVVGALHGVAQTLRGFVGTLRMVETLHCNVSTALLLLMLCCFHAPAFAGLNDGLVAYWSFDDCTAKDSTGQWNGSKIGNPTCTAGRIGQALNFNGSGDRVEVPNFNLDYNQLSISVYARLTGGTNYPEIIGVGNQGSDNGFQLEIWSPSDILMFDAVGSSNSRLTVGGFTRNEWHHVVTVWDGTNSKIYIDGKFVAERTTYQNSNSLSGETLRIGSELDGLSSFWGGEIDELRIYNRALTPNEVTALYQQGTTPTITSITPTETVIGKSTTFEVHGQNLNPNMGFTVGDCAYSNVALAGGTPELQKFVCTQFGAEGAKKGLIKTKPGGTRVFDFAVTAVTEPSPVQTALIKGQLKIGSKLGKQVTLSAGSDVSACQTNNKGNFACQVPAGWTGTLKPEAKGVLFSPAVIAVQNAQGESVANNGQPIIGTTTDVFPVNGVMSKKDWVWPLTDPIGWHVDMSNGELNDLRAYEGRFSFRSSPVKANQYAAIQTTINMPQEGEIRFARRVSSYRGHGVLTFSIDGKTASTWSGEKPWERVIERVTAGPHTLRWVYKRDGEATAKGEDAAWIDDVSYNNLVQLGTTACAGVTQGTLNLMTVTNPSCEQVDAYLIWLKVIRPKNSQDADTVSKGVKNVELINTTVQGWIDDGERIAGYVSPFIGKSLTADGVANIATELFLQIKSDYTGKLCDVALKNPTHQDYCDIAHSMVSEYLSVGIQAGIGGTLSAIPYITAESLGIIANLASSLTLDDITEEINSFNIADFLLDEHYKGGMDLPKMCTQYKRRSPAIMMGINCSGLTAINNALIDAVANKYGYRNAWYGTEYNGDNVLSSINASIAKNKEIIAAKHYLLKLL